MNEFPEDARRFLLDSINSLDQLEVLLLLRGEPGRGWGAEEVARALYTNAEAAGTRLADLRALRLLSGPEGGERLYRYAPETAELASVVDRVADLYKERRVAVVTLIYSKPVDQVQAFADAFRLRKEK